MFYDENGLLLVNPHVNSGLSWSNVVWALFSLDHSNWFPLTWMSHMLDFQLFGTNPWGHHLTNVLFHASNSVLLFLVLKRMTGALWRSLIVAGLSALHPLRVESVAWISERKDVLSTFFWMLALWTYALFVEESRKKYGKTKTFYGLTFLFFFFGLMSKTMLVTFPCVLLLLDFWPLNRWNITNCRRLILEKIPFFLVVLIISKISYVAQQRGGFMKEMASLPLEARVENALVSYARYLGKFFFPSDLCIYYPHPGYWPGAYVLLAALLVVSLSAFAWVVRREFPYLFVGWFWYIGTAVPVIGLEQLNSQSIADRYTYVPTLGVAIIAVWGLHALTARWRHQAKATLLGGGLLLCACVALTRFEIGFWKDGETVWKRALAVTKDNYVAYCCYGIIIGQTDPDQSLVDFQESVKIKPGFAEAERCLATALHQRGRLDEAILHYQAAWNSNPDDDRPQFGLGVAYAQKGETDEALLHFQKAVAVCPGSENDQNYLGILLFQKGRISEAIPHLQKVAELRPDNPAAFNNLGIALIKNGQLDEAITNFQEAVILAPDFAQAQNNLAMALNARQQVALPSAISTNQPAPSNQATNP